MYYFTILIVNLFVAVVSWHRRSWSQRAWSRSWSWFLFCFEQPALGLEILVFSHHSHQDFEKHLENNFQCLRL